MVAYALYDDDVLTESRFQPPQITNGVPEGYMTGTQFRHSVKNKLYNYYSANGLL